VTRPNEGVSTLISRRYKKEGTLTNLALPARCPSHSTNASTKPHGASMPTRVSGVVRATQPNCTAVVASAMVPWPQWSEYPSLWTKITPKSALGETGSVRYPAYISACPRGSRISAVRTWSRLFLSHWRRWTMEFPGMRGRPEVTMRNASPPVWVSTLSILWLMCMAVIPCHWQNAGWF